MEKNAFVKLPVGELATSSDSAYNRFLKGKWAVLNMKYSTRR